MPVIPEEFEWDEGNAEKNKAKHDVEIKECEEVFMNIPRIIWRDKKHSTTEERFIILGKTNIGRGLHVIYTVRHEKIRVISARDQNKKERSLYASQKN